MVPLILLNIVLKEEKGAMPDSTSTITVNYVGYTIDGNIFDSTVESGKPSTFPVSGLIFGLQEAVQLMPIGSKWKIIVPSYLAFGERGVGETIKPNSVLIFEIELISIKAK